MSNNKVHFFYEDTSFKLSNIKKVKSWLIAISEKDGFSVNNINYIICSDNYLLKINKQYLNHDFFTDIITFPTSTLPEPIEADIFISIDRVKDNAKILGHSLLEELHRVLAHGLLHLFGYKDGNKEEKLIMRKKEDVCLSLRDF